MITASRMVFAMQHHALLRFGFTRCLDVRFCCCWFFWRR